MLVGYIKKSYIKSILKEYFVVRSIKRFEKGYVINLPNFKEEKREKILKKLLKKIKKLGINTIVFSKSLSKEEEDFKNILINKKNENIKAEVKDQNILILDGKKIMEYMSLKIFEYILEIQGKIMKQEQIYITINKNKEIDLKFLTEFIENFKTINIITNDLKRFKEIQEKLYEKENILITVSNNKRKALKKAVYILNYNLNEKEIKKYIINRNAVIINVKENIEKCIKGFEGIIVNQIEIDMSDEILRQYDLLFKDSDFEESKIYESYVYHKLQENIKIQETNTKTILSKIEEKDINLYLEKNKIKINYLKGINGIINNEEIIKNSQINSQINKKILTN